MPERTILAIDPGCEQSAYAVIDEATRRPLRFGKLANHELERHLWGSLLNPPKISADAAAIEMVASYGMPVGREVFDTCVWIGRFYSAIEADSDPDRGAPELVYRRDVKLHHCGSAKANDATITQALIDRFAYGARNRGKGTKANPGWFHGFAADIWQAYALAVLVADRRSDVGGAA